MFITIGLYVLLNILFFFCWFVFSLLLTCNVQHVLNIPKYLSKEAIQNLKLSPEGSSTSTSTSRSSIGENTIIEIRGTYVRTYINGYTAIICVCLLCVLYSLRLFLSNLNFFLIL